MLEIFSSDILYSSLLFCHFNLERGIVLNVEQSSLNLELRELVYSHMERHPKLSLNAIAKRAGVASTTLRRLMQDDNRSKVQAHVVLNLSSYILKENNIKNLINITNGYIQEELLSNFSNFIDENKKYTTDEEINYTLSDPIAYIIYKMAANHNGIHTFKINEMFGELGLSKLDLLIARDIVVNDDGMIHAKSKNFALDLQTAKKHLTTLSKFYKPEEVELDLNIMYSQSESINKETIKKIKDIQREASVKIHELLSDKNNWGEYPYFTINLGETLNFKNKREILQ